MAPSLPAHRSAAPLSLQAIAADGAFEGYASVFHHEDLGHDVILPGAFRDSLSRRGAAGVKLLYQHDASEPLGVWETIREDARGLYVRGRLLPGVARAREALALIRAGALDGLSIGFRAVKAQRSPRARVRRLERVDLLEISIVTFPMQPQARIIAVETGGRVAAETRGAGSLLQPSSSRRASSASGRDGKARRDPVLEANARAARAAGARVLAALSRLARSKMEGAAALATRCATAEHAHKYRPDQPRAPAGGPDGGQWVAEGGNDSNDGRVISDANPDDGWKPGAQYAQNRSTARARLDPRLGEPTPAQLLRFGVALNRAETAQHQLRQIDPQWRPPRSLVETVEGEIARLEGEARAAEARYAEILRDAIPAANPSWGVNRLKKELHDQGFVLQRPTRSPGLLYQNPGTGAEVRIMKRPLRTWRTDPPEKHTMEHYYRYREGEHLPFGSPVPIPNKP